MEKESKYTPEENFLINRGWYPGINYDNGTIEESVTRVTEDGYVTAPDADTTVFYSSVWYHAPRTI